MRVLISSVLQFVLLQIQLSVLLSGRTLCTFRTESMRIKSPKNAKNGNVFEEAFQLMRQHFIDRGRFGLSCFL